MANHLILIVGRDTLAAPGGTRSVATGARAGASGAAPASAGALQAVPEGTDPDWTPTSHLDPPCGGPGAALVDVP